MAKLSDYLDEDEVIAAYWEYASRDVTFKFMFLLGALNVYDDPMRDFWLQDFVDRMMEVERDRIQAFESIKAAIKT